MLVRLIFSLHRAVLLLLLVAALVGTGFAHRIATQPSEALVFALAHGASLADICGQDTRGNSHAQAECKACQISTACDFPPPIGAQLSLNLAVQTATTAPHNATPIRRTVDPAHRPQGPPAA